MLLKPGRYRVNLWLGRSRLENIDYVEFAEEFDFFEVPSATKHPEVFPGVDRRFRTQWISTPTARRVSR